MPRVGEIFVGAVFDLPAWRRREALIHQQNVARHVPQPIGSYNCGSVFINPKGDFAARLIESCGLKGGQHGGGNFYETQQFYYQY